MLPSTKKTRSDSTLDSLPEPIQGEIIDRDRANESLSQILAWLAADHAVATSRTALSTWLTRQRTKAMRDGLRQVAADAATLVAETTATNTQAVDDAILATARQHVLNCLMQGGNLATARDLLALLLKSKTQDLDAKRLALDERKFQLLTAETYLQWRNDARAAAIADGPGTHEAKVTAIRELFFAPGETHGAVVEV